MNKTMKAAAAMTVASLMVTSGAEAALVERLGGKAIYDDMADLTWLQDANYAQTSGYDDDGVMNWDQANAWAGSLNIDGVTGWRLPGGPMACCVNQTSSEMGNLFYNVLGGVAGNDLTVIDLASYEFFENIRLTWYWSGVENGPEGAWFFDFDTGSQFTDDKGMRSAAWAVHDGDVGASPVPLPATLFLLAPALAGLGVMRRRGS